MTWLDKLERRIGFLAIPGLLRYVGFFTAFFFGAAFSNLMLTTSLFFAFARFYPDLVIYFAFILPLKVKWIAWFSAAVLLVQIAVGSMQFRAAAICAMANYLIFFGPAIIHDARHRREVTTRRRRFEMQTGEAEAEALHRCAICGATEVTGPNLEFRVARNGEEYCLPHLPKPQAAGTASSKSSG